MLKRLFLFVITAISILSGRSDDVFGQDLQAEVIVNDESLPSDARERLRDFKQHAQDYLNRNKFHSREIPPVKCTFQFTFRSTNGLDGYDAQLFVASQREIYRQDKSKEIKYTTTFRFLDDRVSINYNRSMQFIKNDVIFDPFLSLLNYYAYMIVGFDEDSYFPVGGTSYFQKALDICNKPISNRNGWTETGGGSKPSRLQLAQEILSAKYEAFRKGYFEYHWMGLDSLEINKANAYKYILLGLQRINEVKKSEVKSYHIEIFFDEKNEEISNTFLTYGNRNIYNTFIQYDPAHQRIYEDFKKRAR
jgi:hypothetical protein